MKHNFEERKQNRIDYAQAQAIKQERQSEHLYVMAQKMASVIPFGQPILVGHYSERSDRNYRNKIHNTFGKAFAAADKAAYYAGRVKTIENNHTIFSDDPQAIQKLEAKIKALTEIQEFMKAANKCVRKNDKAGFLALAFGTEKLWAQLNEPDRFNGNGFPHFKLTNNNANLNNVKKRLQQLTAAAGKQTTETTIKGVTLRENVEAGRVQLIFEEKPPEAIRNQLFHDYRFKWCRSEGAWQRHLNGNGIYAAKRFLQDYQPTPPPGEPGLAKNKL